MSLPTLFDFNELFKKKYLVFLVGFSFTIVSIFFSLKLFPEDPGIVAVAFVSMMSLRLFSRIFDSIKSYGSLLSYTFNFYETYMLLFLGVFSAFMIFSFMLSSIAVSTFFKEQMRLFGLSGFPSQVLSLGNAMSFSSTFHKIFSNNIIVLFFCFVVAFFFGTGALFIILWNSSVWGTLLGYSMRMLYGKSALVLFSSVIPHAFLEASSYILVAIAGLILSSMIEHNSMMTKKNLAFVFKLIFFSFSVLLLSAFIESI